MGPNGNGKERNLGEGRNGIEASWEMERGNGRVKVDRRLRT